MKKGFCILIGLLTFAMVGCNANPESSSSSSSSSSNNSSSSSSNNSSSSSSTSATTNHLYTDFTSSEKEMFNNHFGFVIPFLANDEYNVLEDDDEYGYILNYYTVGNTQSEYDAYLNELNAKYTFVQTYVDDYGDTCYVYSQDSIVIDVSYYLADIGDVVDLYMYDLNDIGGGETPETYTDFTNSEKEMFNSNFGFVIPFL